MGYDYEFLRSFGVPSLSLGCSIRENQSPFGAGIRKVARNFPAGMARLGAASVREIHDYANLEKPRVSRTVAKLQKAGLVRKIANRRDSRLVEISLTEQGRTVLGEIVTVATEFESRLVQVLSNEELATLLGIAEKLHSVLDNDPLAPKRSSLDKPAD